MATGSIYDQEIGLGGAGLSQIDTISPRFVGEERISLTLSQETREPAAGQGFIVLVDASAAEPEGLVGPFVITLQTPTGAGFQRYELESLPSGLTFFPQEAGTHLVLVRELGHNRWRGTLAVEVSGETLG